MGALGDPLVEQPIVAAGHVVKGRHVLGVGHQRKSGEILVRQRVSPSWVERAQQVTRQVAGRFLGFVSQTGFEIPDRGGDDNPSALRRPFRLPELRSSSAKRLSRSVFPIA